MIALKKLYGEELLRLALMLSLLRTDPDQYILDESRLIAGGLVNGTDWVPEMASVHTRARFLHPKSLDSMLMDYERDVFEELHSLGRWGGANNAAREAVQAYLLSGVEPQSVVEEDQETYQLENDDVEQCVTIKGEDEEQAEEDQVVDNSVPNTVTLSAGFIRNLTSFEGPILEEDSAQSLPFDASHFFNHPAASSLNQMLKSEPDEDEVIIKEEWQAEDMFEDENDNAMDELMPLFSGGNSIVEENLADLKAFDETPASLEAFKRTVECTDVDEKECKDYQKYLIENTEVDVHYEDTIVNVKRERTSTSFTSCGTSASSDEAYASSSCSEEFCYGADVKVEKDEGLYSGDELTQEDMDLIEVLWKQDVDIGFSIETPVAVEPKCDPDLAYQRECDAASEQVIKELETAGLGELELTKQEPGAAANKPPRPDEDPWAGLAYTIDTETGEYIVSGDLPTGDRFDLLEEALQLVGLDDANTELQGDNNLKQEGGGEGEGEGEGEEMLAPRYHGHAHAHQTAPHHQQHHHHHHAQAAHHHHHAAAQHHFAAAYHHQNLVRSMSVEQRWQDLATLLALPAPPGGAGGAAAQGHHHLAGPPPPPPVSAAGPSTQNPSEYAHHHHHHHAAISALGHVAQPTPAYVAPPYAPLSDKSSLGSSADLYAGSANLGSAVAASMNVSQGPVTSQGGPPGPPPFYKSEHSDHQGDHMYYQNHTSEMNGTSDGFISTFFNDEDLQLMDMAMNEGMYTMRMLESGTGGGAGTTAHNGTILSNQMPTGISGYPGHQTLTTMQTHPHITMGSERVDASSDSAVSSMGSERVPSLSDSEWCDGGSDSAQDYHTKLRPCDGESRQQPLVAQKKHHMFGKRSFQEPPNIGRLRSSIQDETQIQDIKFEYEQPSAPTATFVPDVTHPITPEMKYSCTMEFNNGLAIGGASIRHNHTYSLPPAPPQPPHKPLARDKKGRRCPDGVSSCGGSNTLTRDEKRARALGIPLSVHDIINLPMDEFNERLSKHDLSETQLSLIRDIRRRGKNKVAAQNCRKRKLDQITSLADEVKEVRTRKQRLQKERHNLLTERQRAKEHFAALYRHVFQHLTDGEGNPLSSQQFSLQQAADGSVVLVPRASASLMHTSRSPKPDRHMSTNSTASEDDMDKTKMKQRKSFDQ